MGYNPVNPALTNRVTQLETGLAQTQSQTNSAAQRYHTVSQTTPSPTDLLTISATGQPTQVLATVLGRSGWTYGMLRMYCFWRDNQIASSILEARANDYESFPGIWQVYVEEISGSLHLRASASSPLGSFTNGNFAELQIDTAPTTGNLMFQQIASTPGYELQNWSDPIGGYTGWDSTALPLGNWHFLATDNGDGTWSLTLDNGNEESFSDPAFEAEAPFDWSFNEQWSLNVTGEGEIWFDFVELPSTYQVRVFDANSNLLGTTGWFEWADTQYIYDTSETGFNGTVRVLNVGADDTFVIGDPIHWFVHAELFAGQCEVDVVKMKVKTRFDGKKVRKATRTGNIASLGHAGAAIRIQARHSIRKSPKASSAGTPPHTRRGRLRNAIKYAVEKAIQSVVIGPDVTIAGTSGKAHEFGGHYKREEYDKRPFMGPALEKIKPRLPAMWAGSVKE